MTHKKCYFLHDLASYSIACNINTVEEYDVSFTVNSYKNLVSIKYSDDCPWQGHLNLMR